MKDYYSHTRAIIDQYNSACNHIVNGQSETSDEEDELLQNFCVYLAHALIQDTGYGQMSREELIKVADIINIVCG